MDIELDWETCDYTIKEATALTTCLPDLASLKEAIESEPSEVSPEHRSLNADLINELVKKTGELVHLRLQDDKIPCKTKDPLLTIGGVGFFARYIDAENRCERCMEFFEDAFGITPLHWLTIKQTEPWLKESTG